MRDYFSCIPKKIFVILIANIKAVKMKHLCSHFHGFVCKKIF